MDWNVYFDSRRGFKPEEIHFADVTLESWRQRGHDVHSLIADPLFVNAAAYDFRLQQDSPALKLGFHPIDLRSVGAVP